MGCAPQVVVSCRTLCRTCITFRDSRCRACRALRHRRAAEQIDDWAALGRLVARVLDPDALLDLAAGLVRLRLEPVVAPSINPEQVFAVVDADRRSQALPHIVTSAALRHQASTPIPPTWNRAPQAAPTRAACFAILSSSPSSTCPPPTRRLEPAQADLAAGGSQRSRQIHL
jgi:hypothetical protein